MLVLAPFLVLGAVISKESLGGAGAWGLILAAMNAGALGGGIVALRLRPRRPLLVGVALLPLFAPQLVLLAAAAPAPAVACGSFVAGAAMAIFQTLWQTTLQEQVPTDVLSRVSAYDWFGSVVFLPLGYLVVGPVAAAIGASTTLWLSVGWLLLATVVLLRVPSIRALRAAAHAAPERGAEAVVPLSTTLQARAELAVGETQQ
jgi:hypothetical protein